MSDAYERFMKAHQKKNEPVRVAKASRKLISIEDSFDEDNDVPEHTFNFKREEPINYVQESGSKKKTKIHQQKQVLQKSRIASESSMGQKQSFSPQKSKKSTVYDGSPTKSPQKKIKNEPILQLIDDEDIDQGTQDMDDGQKNESLSIVKSLSLLMGHFMNPYIFPLRRQIPIIANIEDLQRQKFDNGTYVSQAFDNNLAISFPLFFIRAVILQTMLKLSTILWLIAVIISFTIDQNEQYKANRVILLILFIIHIVFSMILQYQSLKGRRNWVSGRQNTKFKVYHYDIHHNTAQWIQTETTDLRPGNIYKLPVGCKSVPADSILLHGNRRIMQVDESPVIQYLSPLENKQKVTLKETVIKKEGIILPLTGVLHYELQAPEVRADNITGRLVLQQPTRQNFEISYRNILLRGSKIINILSDIDEQSSKDDKRGSSSQNDLLALVLQTGIDSQILKNSQYPFQYRNSTPMLKLIDYLLIITLIAYIVITCIGILLGYIFLYNPALNRGYYIDNYLEEFAKSSNIPPVTMKQLTLHHFANYIMVISILLRVMYLLYVNIMSRVVQSKIGVQVKDMEMITECSNIDVLVTTIGGDLVRSSNKNEQKNSKAKMNKTNNSNNILDAPNSQQIENEKNTNLMLQSIRVKQIHHNFQQNPIDSEIYSTEDVDLMLYFMSIALLTVSLNAPSPLEQAINACCASQLQLKAKINSKGKGKNDLKMIKIGQLEVQHLFTIPASAEEPYKVLFFKHSKKNIVEEFVEEEEEKMRMNETNSENEKILCLVRGDPVAISLKNGNKKNFMSDYSTKVHQEKGLHLELLGKFVITYGEFLIIKKAYLGGGVADNIDQNLSSSGMDKVGRNMLGIEGFYSNFDRFLMKVDPMGLLIWQNPYNVSDERWSPISSLPYPAYKIIIAPQSKSLTNSEFQSIHSITNYLLKTFKFPLYKISNKILHGYSGKQTFWKLLKEEEVLVLNGWDNDSIRKMLQDLGQVQKLSAKNKSYSKKKKYDKSQEDLIEQSKIAMGNNSVKILGYIEHDQYAWVLKETNLALVTEGDGFDLPKYADISLGISEKTAPQKLSSLFSWSIRINSNLSCLIMNQISKGIMLAIIQFINSFYTWGTGLVIFGTQLYLILEIGLFMDLFYYLVIDIPQQGDMKTYREERAQAQLMQQQKNKPIKIGDKTQIVFIKNKKQEYYVLTGRTVLLQLFMNGCISIFIYFISLYSMVQPPTSLGTFAPKQFTNILILFCLYHTLIFRKIFYPPYKISIFKILIVLFQILIFYIGIIVLSEVDTYEYRGAIWYVFQGRTILVGIFIVWMICGIYWVKFMFQQLLAKSVPKSNSYKKIEQKDNSSVDDKSQGSEFSVLKEDKKNNPSRNTMTHQIIELD